MKADSCNDFKQCVKYSKNPADVDICVFSCDDLENAEWHMVFVLETQSCEIPSFSDMPCEAKR